MVTSSKIPIVLGPIDIEGYNLTRSGVRWLHEDGQPCSKGEIIAFCNIVITSKGSKGPRLILFNEESQDLKIAISTPISGRVRHSEERVLGGWGNIRQTLRWDENDVVGYIEPQDESLAKLEKVQGSLFMVAGRRVTPIAEDHSGLLTGWFDRTRACSLESEGPIGTLLSLGICNLRNVIRGESSAFLEIIKDVTGHVVNVSDNLLVYNSRVMIELLNRQPTHYHEILRDFSMGGMKGQVLPFGIDWAFAGEFLRCLQVCHFAEDYKVATRKGVKSLATPEAILLSLEAETSPMMRHLKLGYAFSYQGYRRAQFPPAFKAWLQPNFELVKRNLYEIHADYVRLIKSIRERAPSTQILVVNMMSSSAEFALHRFGDFESPIGETAPGVRAQDLNLLLCDLAREHDVAIVDADAIAAKFGGKHTMPDGVHTNGIMEAELRREILRIMKVKNIPGFNAPAVN